MKRVMKDAVENADKTIIETRYSPNNLYVGPKIKNVRMQSTFSGKARRKSMLYGNVMILNRIRGKVFQDIATGECYKLRYVNDNPEGFYVSERYLEGFVSTCCEVLYNRGINGNELLTVQELQDILKEQEQINERVL